MKRFIQMLVLVTFMTSCSSLPDINIPQLGASPTAPPTFTTTPTPSQTSLPTQDLFATSTPTPLTFTPTVTSIGAELFTPTSTPTLFPTARPTQPAPTAGSVTPALLPGGSLGGLFTPQATGFLTILTSSPLMYWNEGPCSPRNIEITAIVTDPANTDRVVLFTRLREKRNTLNVTRWNAGAIMVREDDVSFHYNIRTFNLRRYFYFREAWLEYQLVAFDKDLQEIGRTPIYDRNLSLVQCQPVS